MEIIKPLRWYSKTEIEQKAEELLHSVESQRCRRLKAVNLAEVVADYLDLGIVWDDLQADAEGEIAAMILPTERKRRFWTIYNCSRDWTLDTAHRLSSSRPIYRLSQSRSGNFFTAVFVP